MAVTRVQSCGCCASSSSAGGGGKLSLSYAQQVAVLLGTETIVAEWNADFDDVTGASIQVRLAALIKSVPEVSGTGTSTFRVRVGGTIATVDGTVRATITTASTTYVKAQNQGLAFANPGGQVLVKVTAAGQDPNGTAGIDAYIRGIVVTIG